MGSGGTAVEKFSLRKAYAEALLELGRKRKDVVVLDADLALSTQTARFGEAFPNRFFDMGISEADMIDTAVGLAISGKLVFVSTFAMFAVGKPWEQIRNSAAYSGVHLNIVATHSGISVGEDGSSHQCIEDMALIRIIPGTTVIAPADDVATYDLVKKLADQDGLCYMRLTRPNLPRIYEEGSDFQIGKAKVLRKGKDVTIVAAGSMVWPSLRASDSLKKDGISTGVIDMHTVKPLDSEPVLEAAEKSGFIVTAEEHNIIGGLGEAVASLLAERRPTPLKRIGVQDRFGESGSCTEIMDFFGLTPEGIAETIKEAVNKRT
ncbi:transketolase family protein [candidate division WOR-3 bacterium]|nr:transketolase family protein [candidate division WOR-3 bacterium]